jgi:hypothetical protein
MQVGEGARAVLRVGVFALALAALAGAWEVLASQAPGSPLFIGMLPGPIQLLREAAWCWGVLICLAGLLLGPLDYPRRWLRLLQLALLLSLGSSLYAATTGMHGLQALDLRQDAPWLFAIKYTARLGLCICLFDLARRGLSPSRSV